MGAQVTPIPGDFFLAPITGDIGRMVQFGQFLNGEGFLMYQHAGILLQSGKTIEAMPGGAIIGEISRYRPEELRWSSQLIEPSIDQRVLICEYGRACRGVPYSFADYGALALHRFNINTPGLRHYIETSGHMICSQLVDYIYGKAGVQLFNDGRWPGYVTPASLNNLLEEITTYRMGQGI